MEHDRCHLAGGLLTKMLLPHSQPLLKLPIRDYLPMRAILSALAQQRKGSREDSTGARGQIRLASEASGGSEMASH